MIKLIIALVFSLLLSCNFEVARKVNSENGDPTTIDTVSCNNIEEITSKIYYTFVIHNEEDDANGIPSSSPWIPDYNGDEEVFNHFADAMYNYALMLSQYGAKLSFQPDWTFVEGVMNFRENFFSDLLLLGNVEVLPHAHETYKAINDVYNELEALNAKPEKIIGGMSLEAYQEKQSWLETHPDYLFWGAPLASSGHTADLPAPPLIYRMKMPEDINVMEDAYIHDASSSVIVTPGIPGDAPKLYELKPKGLYITPSYTFQATRYFLANSDNYNLPNLWKKNDISQKTSEEIISNYKDVIESRLLLLKEQGKLEFKTVSETAELFKKYEHCLDLYDGKDLSSELLNKNN